MALDLYRKKRDFSKTPEPPPQKAGRRGFSYCIQKHDATRLHYDFRLELDGVLKSWAVTKGPSLDPADKRLAVRTEDHPVSYGGFEGVIPAGEYGGGTVMLWDKGSWTPLEDPREGLKRGRLVFEIHGERLQGKWVLIRMKNRKASDKRENWLLIKERDDESRTGRAAARFLDKTDKSVKTGRNLADIAGRKKAKRVAAEIKPKKPRARKRDWASDYKNVQLATLVDKAPAGDDWLHEVKFDGYRILCIVDHGDVAIKTRNGNDWTDRFPSIVAALKKLKASQLVIDGEAVVLDSGGISRFQDLQERLGEGGDRSDIHAYFFDLLHLDGEDIRKKQLIERKKLLKKLLSNLPKKSPVHYSDHFESGDKILQQSCRMGLEGIVSKKKAGAYQGGRGKSWLKSKCGKRQEFVIIGYTASKKGPRAIGALHLAYYKGRTLTYAGKVGTGFSLKTAAMLLSVLKPMKVPDCPVAHVPTAARRGTTWVRPDMVCEVSFTEWTKDGHIRHPSFEGKREDKMPRQITQEKPEKIKPASRTNRAPLLNGVAITHPDREVYPEDNVSKYDIASYYSFVAPLMLKEIRKHPISLLRCPSGVDHACFFQRNPDKSIGPGVKPFSFRHNGKSYEYLYVENQKGLIFLAQMGVIEIHPWGAPVNRIDYPDKMVFDLDPDENLPFDAVKMAAIDVRKRLQKLGLESFVKTTGGKGLHVMAPLNGRSSWEDVKAFAKSFAEGLARSAPAAYTATMSKEKRRGKIFIDYFRNDYTATAIADYSLRARPGAPVAVPLRWEELKDLTSAHDLTIEDVIRRLKRKKPDLERYRLKQALPKIE